MRKESWKRFRWQSSTDHIFRGFSSSYPCHFEPRIALISSFKLYGLLRNQMRPSLYSKVAETRIGVPEEVVVRSLVSTMGIRVRLFRSDWRRAA